MQTTTEHLIIVACDCDEFSYRAEAGNTVQSLRKQWGSHCPDCGDKIDIKPVSVVVELERLRTQLNPLAE